jgi:glyoxylase-like metal-dependent hydrolase (beta-lactamase superfamily II)
MSHKVEAFFDKDTYTLTYVVYDDKTKDAVIIDSVLNYDPAASKVSDDSIKMVLSFIKEKQLNAQYVLETHAHADHLTGAAEIKKRLPSIKIGVGKNITKVQSVFSDIYNLKDFNTSGVQFDILLDEHIVLRAGKIEIKAIFTPGHTPACSSYLIEDMLFVGDALFMPDYGTGRCDFPAGSAKDLYNSIHGKLYQLPEQTRVFTGHDYQPNGRKLEYQSTIGIQKTQNIQLKESTTESEFIEFRTKRDATLSAPRLLLPSIQINIDAGNLPKAEDNGAQYLKIPLKITGDL